MVSRAIKAAAVGLAYVVAGIPALIGIAFVARYAFVTSDTSTDGAATAFLFGMVAAGAFTGPVLPPLLPVTAERSRGEYRTSQGRQTSLLAIAGGSDAPMAPNADEIDPKPVIAFLAAHMPADRGSRADWGDLYGGFLTWQTERGGNALPASQFGAVLRHICEQAGIRVRRHGDRVYCLDRRVTWKA